MSTTREQLSQNSRWPGSHWYRYRSGSRRWQKRQMNRWLRRQVRKHPGQAPVKRSYDGVP